MDFFYRYWQVYTFLFFFLSSSKLSADFNLLSLLLSVSLESSTSDFKVSFFTLESILVFLSEVFSELFISLYKTDICFVNIVIKKNQSIMKFESYVFKLKCNCNPNCSLIPLHPPPPKKNPSHSQ